MSLKIKKRFPTEQHLLAAGLMTEEELSTYQGMPGDFGKWFHPLLSRRRELGPIQVRAHFLDGQPSGRLQAGRARLGTGAPEACR